MPATLHSDVVDAALACAASLLGMDVVLVLGFAGDRCRYERVLGAWPGVDEGYEGRRAETFCAVMLDEQAPPATADAAHDPHYAKVPDRERLGVTSYVGVPVHDRSGRVVATLCGIDHRQVPVTETTLEALRSLAAIVGTQLPGGEGSSEVVIRRTPAGWLVGDDEEAPCLTSAMILADLLAEDLTPPQRPPKPAGELGETARLQLALSQLEHALAARVVVEQAIGVLAERLGTRPRDAFELLRKVARRNGVRVHELSRDVVASVEDPSVRLPAELAKRR